MSDHLDTTMSFILPITSPAQGSNRVLPSWGGTGSPALDGLAGVGRGVGSTLTLGDLSLVASTPSIAPTWLMAAHSALRLAGTVLGGYHGYQRTDSIWGAIGYSALMSIVPIIGIPVIVSQGLGEKS